MGGVGYGLRTSKHINPMNPASYSNMDSLTFLFDVGATLQLSLLNDEKNSHRNLNGNLMYLAMQFPLSRNMAMSAGILPYSHTGYSFNLLNDEDGISHSDYFFGKGGLNEVYVGWSINIWKKRLTLGTNVSYLFGIIEHNSEIRTNMSEVRTLYTTKKMNLRKLKYDLGVQYTHPLSRADRMTFGLAYSPKLRLSSVLYDLLSSNDPYFTPSGLIQSDTLHNQKFDIPHSIGIGTSYERENKITVAADLSFQQWSKALYNGENNIFKDRIKFVVGGEYIPNILARKYLSSIRYRAGLNYSNSYLQVNGSGYNEYGVSVGVGLPMLDNRSFINISFEYVNVAPKVKSLINEQYFRCTLSFTFNEMWFRKLRMD